MLGTDLQTQRNNQCWKHSKFAFIPSLRKAGSRSDGMTMVEILVAVAIVGMLGAIAIPTYADYIYRAQIVQAKSDIMDIGIVIAQFQSDNGGDSPDDLAMIGKGGSLDPWGNQYGYFNLVTKKGKGNARKNKNLTPINSDYDLYSMGSDGDSKGPLTAKTSLDDIVRANNGRFIGLASDY